MKLSIILVLFLLGIISADYESTAKRDSSSSSEYDMHKEWVTVKTASNYRCSDTPEICGSSDSETFYGSYQQLDAIYYRLDRLAEKYNNTVSTGSAGLTYDKNHMRYYKLSAKDDNEYTTDTTSNNNNDTADDDDDKKPVIIYFCAEHAREWITAMFCPYLMETLLAEESSGPDGLLTQADWIILPVMNVDSFLYTHEVSETNLVNLLQTFNDADNTYDEDLFWELYTQTKTRVSQKPNPTGCFLQHGGFNKDYDNCIEDQVGTDLNRNYPFMWGTGGSDNDPGSDIYHGVSPADNIEVQNMMNFVRNITEERKVLAATDVHCCMGSWLLPWGFGECKGERDPNDKQRCRETYMESPDYDRQLEMANVTTTAIANFNGKAPYSFGSIPTTIYKASGSSLDYFYGELGIVFTSSPELYDSSDMTNKALSFQPKESNILPAIKEAYVGCIAGMKYALAHQDAAKFVAPFPKPGFALEDACMQVKNRGLCGEDCGTIKYLRIGKDVDSEFLPQVMPATCGSYQIRQPNNADQDVREWTQEVEIGVPFYTYCSKECANYIPVMNNDSTNADDDVIGFASYVSAYVAGFFHR